MTFREQLLATIRAAKPVLEVPGVLIVGSEVPNLLQTGAASTLVVSQDLDVGVPVQSHAELKRRVASLSAFTPSVEEPSVWLPSEPHLIEINFVGMDAGLDPADAYVLDDEDLPLMVFGALALVTPGAETELAGTRVCLPRPAGLMLEKLVSDRTGEKGERDLLVALGLLSVMGPEDLDEFIDQVQRLRSDLRHAVRSNLTILSLLAPHAGMPDPTQRRGEVSVLLRRLERTAGVDS